MKMKPTQMKLPWTICFLLHHLISALIAAIPFRDTHAAAAAFSLNTKPRKFHSVRRMASESPSPSTSSTSSTSYSWRPGIELLLRNPSALSDGTPRLARDEAYASSIMKAWGDEVGKRTSNDSRSVASPFVYKCKVDGSSLHGHIYRPSPPPSTDDVSAENSIPGIVLFHTGAGPQDAFLRWKADSLVSERGAFGDDGGCVVLVADIIGDEDGWAWRDRERYANVRGSVLVPDEDGERKNLAGRAWAAIEAVAAQPGVDARRIGAMGFCMGGHPILELARMNHPSVRAMVTFHGVFDGVGKLSSVETSSAAAKCNVLVCTGEDDPFILKKDLGAAMKMFSDLGYQSDVMTFEHARHGFTNPAQDYNPNEAFGYNDDAYTKAWSAALSLLKGMSMSR